MFSLEIECAADERELLVAELWEYGTAGIVELDPRRVRAFFEDGADRAALLALYPGSPLRIEETRDWAAFARDLFQPIEAGKRFYLAPPWRDDPTPEGRFRIVVNPGLAFGTGVHETTQLCLEALEEFVKPGLTVLDVGTGSGILGRAAELLGAVKVFACDIDAEAVELAGSMAPTALRFVGSVDAVAAGAADLIVANISPEAITRLAPELLRARKAGGTLVASGFERHEAAAMQAALPPARALRDKGNWSLLVI